MRELPSVDWGGEGGIGEIKSIVAEVYLDLRLRMEAVDWISSDKEKPEKIPERGKKWKRSRIKICCRTTPTMGGLASVGLLKERVSNGTAVNPASETSSRTQLDCQSV
jgi:hypothetical protein